MANEFRLTLDRERPFVAVSSGKSTIFRTGVQRSERPVFASKSAPCRFSCPIGINIAGAFDLASQGDWHGALCIYLEENPLPGVCGRICYHPCEAECNRGKLDEPINIRGLERFLSDHGEDGVAKRSRPRFKNKVAVVGSGPAGLSNAYQLARLGYPVSLFEARRKLGGMLRYGIPAYRLPRSVLDRDMERVLSLGITVHVGQSLGKNLSWAGTGILRCRVSVFRASRRQVDTGLGTGSRGHCFRYRFPAQSRKMVLRRHIGGNAHRRWRQCGYGCGPNSAAPSKGKWGAHCLDQPRIKRIDARPF